MVLPDQFKTGNKKLDAALAVSFRKDPFKPNRLERILGKDFAPLVDKKNKYGVADKEDRTYKDGTLFASKLEMERWDYLLMLEKAGEIKDLQKQVEFVLQEGFHHYMYGLVKPVIYVSDFVYINISFRKGHEGKVCVEDSKSGPTRTKEYRIKRRLFLYKYPQLLFFEVT